jgi:hypothetical protein
LTGLLDGTCLSLDSRLQPILAVADGAKCEIDVSQTKKRSAAKAKSADASAIGPQRLYAVQIVWWEICISGSKQPDFSEL